MDWLLGNYQIIFTAFVAIFTAFKWLSGIKFINFGKEAVDVYAKFDEFDKDGKWVEEEYTKFGKEVVEMVKSGKGLLKK